jgi:hypothetical protein
MIPRLFLLEFAYFTPGQGWKLCQAYGASTGPVKFKRTLYKQLQSGDRLVGREIESGDTTLSEIYNNATKYRIRYKGGTKEGQDFEMVVKFAHVIYSQSPMLNITSVDINDDEEQQASMHQQDVEEDFQIDHNKEGNGEADNDDNGAYVNNPFSVLEERKDEEECQD